MNVYPIVYTSAMSEACLVHTVCMTDANTVIIATNNCIKICHYTFDMLIKEPLICLLIRATATATTSTLIFV